MSKKLKRSTGFEGMPFGEALERLFGVDPQEMESEIDKTKREAGDKPPSPSLISSTVIRHE